MNSEKQNKMPAWRESLLKWEQSAGGATQKEDMLWDKLQDRLQQPTPVKRRIYFFRAAAILLFLLAIAFVLIQKKKTPDTIFSIQPVIKTDLPAVAKKENSTTPIKPVALPVKEKHIAKSLNPVQEKVTTEPVIEKEVINNDPASLVQVQPSVQEQSSTVIIPKKKKLKVVHMNELNAPPPPTFATLKEEWSAPSSPAEEIITPPSIWPGKNKNRSSVSLGN